METKILCFVRNGTCEKYARKLSENISANISFFPFEECIFNDTTIILIIPVYAEDIHPVFMPYLNSLTGSNTNVIINVVYGGISIGKSLYSCINILNKKFRIIGASILNGKHNYSNINKHFVSSEGPNNNDLTSFKDFILKSISSQNEIITNSISNKKRIFANLPNRLLEKMSVRLPKTTNSCIKCKKCIDICPFNAIDMNLKIDQSKCIRCLKCALKCEYQGRVKKFSQPFIKYYLNKNYKENKNKYIN